MNFKAPRKKPVDYEMYEQEAVAQYIATRYPWCLFTATAGGLRTSMYQAIKMKRTGYRKGCPDLFIEEPLGGFHGLRIEMKTAKNAFSDKGSASKEQIEWVNKLNIRGYKAMICYGRDEAIVAIDKYLNEVKGA